MPLLILAWSTSLLCACFAGASSAAAAVRATKWGGSPPQAAGPPQTAVPPQVAVAPESAAAPAPAARKRARRAAGPGPAGMVRRGRGRAAAAAAAPAIPVAAADFGSAETLPGGSPIFGSFQDQVAMASNGPWQHALHMSFDFTTSL
ncbi:hypothetical protein COCOBI_03-0310 [Coccomyxa sp. Obi]|nr:hypothetical protein COCOBI_03-0310 [Coccomyxa sp. Obi]